MNAGPGIETVWLLPRHRKRALSTIAVLLSASFYPAFAQFALQSARRSWSDHTRVTLIFSQAVDPVSASDPRHYKIDLASVQSARPGTDNASIVLTTSPIDYGPAPTLHVTGVYDATLAQSLSNAVTMVSISPILPAEMGTVIHGFQDDFDSPNRNPDWIPQGPDVYFQSDGTLNVSSGGGDPNDLIYANPAYGGANETILARLRITGTSAQQTAFAGVAVGVPTNSLSASPPGGMNLLLLNPGAYGGPASNYEAFLDDYIAFGPALSFSWQTNVWYWLRLQQETDAATGHTVAYAKIWPADGDTSEPTNWQQSYDYSPSVSNPRSGFAGFRAGILDSSNNFCNFQVDYVLIEADGLPGITPMPDAFRPNPVLPLLRLSLRDSLATVSWPPNAGDLLLEESTDLLDWLPTPWPVSTNQDSLSITEPVAGPARYFRTAEPPPPPAPDPAFAFNFGTQTSGTIQTSWPSSETVTQPDTNTTERFITYTQPDGAFQTRLQSIDYSDFPARDWLLWFENLSNPSQMFPPVFYIDNTGLTNASAKVTFAEHSYNAPDSGNPAQRIVTEYSDLGIFFDGSAPAYWSTNNFTDNVTGGEILNYQPYGPGFTQPSFPIHFTQPVTNAAFAMIVQGGSTAATFDLIRDGAILYSTNAPVGSVNTSNIYVFGSVSNAFDTIQITPNVQPAYIHVDNVQHSINPKLSVSVDFNGYTPGSDPLPVTCAGGGPGGAGFGAGNLWNGVLLPSGGQNTVSPLTGFLAQDGSATTLSLSISNFAGADYYSTDNYATNQLFDDYIVQTSGVGPAGLTIGGLIPGAIYEMYLFASNDGGGAGGVFSVNGSPSKMTVAGPGTPFREGYDFVHFTTQADAQGELVVTVTGEVDVGGGTLLSVVNGFQITGPSATALTLTSANAPVLSNVWPGHIILSRPATGEFKLHYADGSTALISDFQPHCLTLAPNLSTNFTPFGGRSSDGVMPYFNVENPDGTGLVIAVGWTGEWEAQFQRDAGTNLTINLGLQQMNVSLRPGEKIRTPAVLAMSYSGDWLTGQRLFRRLMLAHYTPRPGGLPPVPPVAASGATIGFNNVSESNQIQAINNIASNALPVDTYWIDAGWSEGGFPLGMGTWTPDPARFPNGLSPVGLRAHEAGLRFLVWFEPERVMPGTWLRTNHPDWLLAPSNLPPALAYQTNWTLLDLGDPAALQWAETNFSAMIGDDFIDIYRHDCNIDPLYYWRNGEAPDRQGMKEIKYVMGLYDYFDTLQRDHPDLLMDNSASGGRRLDFEMMRRTVPLLRTDYLWDPVGAQCMTYALSLWLPLTGQGAVLTDNYDFRSGMGTFVTYAFNYYSATDSFWASLTRLIESYKPLQPLFSGDFYPLTAYSTNQNVWIAWQFDRPDLGQGLVQAFRRASNPTESVGLRLQGLDPAADYQVANLDQGGSSVWTGQQLMADGLVVVLTNAPDTATFHYQRAP
ncbi:MAG: alpha-galactosidase [Verrucomicrobiota bacterium]|nr:alpha-galactosidase [Verrucomicrobiota bacterium]